MLLFGAVKVRPIFAVSAVHASCLVTDILHLPLSGTSGNVIKKRLC
jgi:hypothetical protein